MKRTALLAILIAWILYAISTQVNAEVNVRDMGALGNGATDDTAAIQAAINKAEATGQCCVYIPSGYYPVGTLSVTSVLSIRGDSEDTSILIQRAANCIVVNSASPVHCEKFEITNQSSGGAGIVVQGGNHKSTFNRLTFYNSYDAIDFVNCDTWHVEQTHIEGYTHWGLSVQNTGSWDSGDSEVSGCFFSTQPMNGATAINQISGDGLRVTNCKMLGGNVGIAKGDSDYTHGNLMISNCSIEAQTIAGIYITGPFANVTIEACEFEFQVYPIFLENVYKFTIGDVIVDSPEFYGMEIINSIGSIGKTSIRANNPISVIGGSVQQ